MKIKLKWLFSIAAVLCVVVLNATSINASGEEEIGRSPNGSWNGGTFYESLTKEIISETETTITYKIRYRITHDGKGGYCYQNSPVYLDINGKLYATYSSQVGSHIRGESRVCGETTMTLSKGENYHLKLYDNSSGSYTSIHVEADIFHKLSEYTATFDAVGGTSVLPITKPYGSKIGTLPTSNKLGYVFEGWYTEVDAGSKISSNTLLTKNITYYAHWKKAVELKVFDRTFLKNETITNEKIVSGFTALENGVNNNQNIFVANIEFINSEIVGTYQVEASYKCLDGYIEPITFKVYIIENPMQTEIRFISKKMINTISVNSIWKDRVAELENILERNTTIETIIIEKGN